VHENNNLLNIHWNNNISHLDESMNETTQLDVLILTNN